MAQTAPPSRPEVSASKFERARSWASVREQEVLNPVGFSPDRSLLLRSRVPLHLVLRLTTRVVVACHPIGRGRRGWYAASAACAAWDVVEAFRLAANPDPRLGRRLAADVADVAVWSSVYPKGFGYGATPIVGAPLITEASLRYSWLGAVLPLFHLAGVTAARRLSGKPARLVNMGYLFVAAAGGLGVRHVERARVRRVQSDFEVEREAGEATAKLAGRYRITQRTYLIDGREVKPHDRLSGLRTMFPEARHQDTVLRAMMWGGHKGALKALASERAVELDTALRAWKKDTNEGRTAVRHQVNDPALPAEQGLTLLSGAQAQRLGSQLDTLGLSGDWAVSVTEATRPGARVVLVIEQRSVVLGADPPELRVTKTDPTPLAPLVGGVAWALSEATELADSAPVWSVLPGVAAFALLAPWCNRVLADRGEAAHGQIIRMSALAALLQASVVQLATRGEPDRPDGSQRCPIQVALGAPAVIAGFCGPSLPRRARVGTALFCGSVLAVGLSMLERPRWRRDLATNFIWTAAAFFPSLAYRRATDSDAERAQKELHERAIGAAGLAALAGEQLEWSLIEQACAEAIAEIHTVDGDLRDEVKSELLLLRRLAKEQQDNV